MNSRTYHFLVPTLCLAVAFLAGRASLVSSGGTAAADYQDDPSEPLPEVTLLETSGLPPIFREYMNVRLHAIPVDNLPRQVISVHGSWMELKDPESPNQTVWVNLDAQTITTRTRAVEARRAGDLPENGVEAAVATTMHVLAWGRD